MIPKKLFLRNFMCYRDNVPPISFDGIHLACLCGNNGNGKSALIDAITWAVWGRSRAKWDDELIHTGSREMEVEFDFAVGEIEYRVTRKRARARPRKARARTERPGQTVLEFQVAAEEGFKSISGDSVAQTQERIIHTLHMDYPTFVNSAFLRQGHADEFTVKPPGERKKVLAEIMGLSLYDELEDRAKSRARERQEEQNALESAMREMEEEIGRKGDYEAALAEVATELAVLDKEVVQQESQVGVLRERKKGLDFKQEQLRELEQAAEQARTESSRWQSRQAQHARKVEEYEGLLQQRAAVKEGYARLEQCRKEAADLDVKLQESFRLAGRRDSLLQVINEARGKTLEERGRLRNKIEELEAGVGRLVGLGEQLARARDSYGSVSRQERELEEKRHQVQELTVRIQYLRSANAQLAQELKESREKLALLLRGDARCPLCETELGAEGKQRIEEKSRGEMSAKADAQRGNESEIKEKAAQHQEASRQVAQLETRVKQERQSIDHRIAGLEKEVALGKQAEVELPGGRGRLAQIERQLAEEQYAVVEQQALKEVGQQIEGLGYDSGRHQKVRELLSELEKYDDLQRKLNEAEASLPAERTALQQARDAIAGWESTLKANGQKMTVLAEEIAALPSLVGELARVEQAYSSLRQRQTGVRDRMVALREKLDRCSQLEKRRGEKEQSLLKASKEKEIYEELAQAFGKRGVQAFLIESALPEIEDETNRLLGKMTDDRMHVTVNTQRETRKGETIETLDIKITDELGTRSYEMYSGGEAFRVNLALRIALSKLLARRAGAPLPTLFIDEGFGTQDTDGLGKLVEAINSIQDDFRKIIVITHLESLKEVFPVRIEVTKTGEGAAISLS